MSYVRRKNGAHAPFYGAQVWKNGSHAETVRRYSAHGIRKMAPWYRKTESAHRRVGFRQLSLVQRTATALHQSSILACSLAFVE